ncbi:hypothetical protein H4R19_001080 [Coemansia spiralis]|nr:hypothetical protein H4R19_001080 [Coemansia spiralis]
MALLCELPEKVLGLVLHEYVHEPAPASVAFKRSLPLLAVCQKLRRLALPLVYSCVFVQYGSKPRPQMSDHMAFTTPSDGKAEPAVAATNAPLVESAGLAGAVTRAVVDVYYLDNPLPGLAKAVKAMQESAGAWAKAVDLEVAMHPDFIASLAHGPSAAEHAGAIGNACGALRKLVPDVRRLVLDTDSQDAVVSAVYGRLAGFFAKQLHSLHCARPIDHQPGHRFTQLRSLHYDCNNNHSHPLPLVDAGQLERLTLRNLAADHPWTSFSGGTAGEITFGKLRLLDLEYRGAREPSKFAASRQSNSSSKAKLHFSALAAVRLVCFADSCPLLEQAVLPAHMQRVELRAPPAVYRAAAKRGLPTARRLALAVEAGTDAVPKIFPSLNQLLDRAQGSEQVEVVVNDAELPVLPRSIKAANLTWLAVAAPTSTASVAAILQRFPGLAHLDVPDLALDNGPLDLALPEPDSTTRLAPLSTSLRKLTLGVDNINQVPGRLPAIAQYLLLRLPALARLVAPDVGRQAMVGLVEKYATAYPHLAGVSLYISQH